MNTNKTFASFIFLLLIAVGFSACSKSETKDEPVAATLSQKIDLLINNDEYEEALALLDSRDESAEVTTLKEKVHLNYGIYLIYNSDPANMRENANNALRQFVQVLYINPENQKAISEIEQILNIYRTFPDRKPAEDVSEDLKELGFEI